MSQAMSDLCNEIVNQRKKITLATFKSWMRKNEGRILINVKSEFDGMIDGCESCRDGFRALMPATARNSSAHNLGFNRCWLVLGGRDYFERYEDDGLIGIEVSNSCGRFIVAVNKQRQDDPEQNFTSVEKEEKL